MKTVSIFIAIILVACGFGFAQTERLQSGDSVRVELERKIISDEMTQLRDSISQSLKIFDLRIKKARVARRQKLESARKELTEYQNMIKLDLKETATTAQNAWSEDSVKRMRANTVATRREYKRICTIL
jgi:ribosomal protein L16 Arg81 hydroxylase